MSGNDYAASLQMVLAHEGGYVNHPADPGGPTNKGVTQRVYDGYRRNKSLDVRSVCSITSAEVADIYKNQYWDRVQGDRLPAGIDYATFDYAVNSGEDRAIKDLQRTLNANANYYGISGQLPVDGAIGEGTIAATCKAADKDEKGLVDALCQRRLNFMKSLRTWGTFGTGWQRRVTEVTAAGERMAANDLSYPIPKAELPAAIGTSDGETAGGKAHEADVSAASAPATPAAATAGLGVTGSTIMGAAQQVQPQIGDTIFGKVALGAFVILTLLGAFLLYREWRKHQIEKGGTT